MRWQRRAKTDDLRAASPEVNVSVWKSQILSICDFDSLKQCPGPWNMSSPGYHDDVGAPPSFLGAGGCVQGKARLARACCDRLYSS